MQIENGVEDEMIAKPDMNKWFSTFSFVSKLFREADIEHAFIKLADISIPMWDIDVLIPNPIEELRALKLLSQHGFKFFKPRLLGHPLKIMCEREGFMSVDIYPDVMWIRKKVADGIDIVSRRRLVSIKETKAYVPSPEDSFYIIATHAYSHLRIKPEDIQKCVIVISESEDFSWNRVYDLSLTYGTMDAVYLLLKILSELELVEIEDDVLSKFLSVRICRMIESWMKKQELKLPFRIPTRFGCVLSSFYHSPKIVRKAKFTDVLYDFFTHYLAMASMKLTGET